VEAAGIDDPEPNDAVMQRVKPPEEQLFVGDPMRSIEAEFGKPPETPSANPMARDQT